MGDTTSLVLKKRLRQAMGDWIEVLVTTAINADNSVVSTNLNQYDGGLDDAFNDPSHWCYITDKANAGVSRQISDYVTSGGTLTIRGNALSDDAANLATIRVSQHDPALYLRSIDDAIQELYPSLLRYFDLDTLVTDNLAPNGHFEDQATSGTPDKYSYSNASGTKETTDTWGGTNAVKVTASAANGYMTLKSDTYPRLLDIMDKSITVKVKALPEAADDATIVIYTKQADGTEKTLTSTTTCPAGEFTLLELENQNINDNLVEVEIRLKITTNAKYVIFDALRVTGRDVREYLLPTDVKNGSLAKVYIQSSGYSDDPCDDLHPANWSPVYGFDIIPDGTDEYLRLPFSYTSSSKIRLVGDYPLETLSSDTDTIALSDEKQLKLLIAHAKYLMYLEIEGPVSSEDISRYDRASYKAFIRKEELLITSRMTRPAKFMNIRSVY